MRDAKIILTTAIGIALSTTPLTAEAGWQGGSRKAKCVKPDSELTSDQQQSLSAAVRGGTPVWNAAGQMDQASATASTHQVLSQGAYDQAWIRYELCVALDNNHIDQATYDRLFQQSLMGSLGGSAPTQAAPVQAAPVQMAPVQAAPAAGSSGQEWMQQLQAQTSLRSGEGYANMAGAGYSLLDVASTDLLAPGGAATVPLNLPLGYEYAVMGVCDNDCSDLDLSVLKSGVELSVDTSTDDWPVVQVTPTGSPSGYGIKVTMYRCSHSSSCGYQLTVWQRAVQTPEPPSNTSSVDHGSDSSVQGTLASGDFTLPNGEWADVYTIDVQAGQTMAVSMTSSDIDTYVVARAPSGATESNDDCNGDRARSCVNFVAAESGEWSVYATSYEANDAGSYELQVSIND